MKITKSQLKQIIKEELEETLTEQPNYGEQLRNEIVKNFQAIGMPLINLNGRLRKAVKFSNSGVIKADPAAAQKALDAAEKLSDAYNTLADLNNAFINSIKLED